MLLTIQATVAIDMVLISVRIEGKPIVLYRFIFIEQFG